MPINAAFTVGDYPLIDPDAIQPQINAAFTVSDLAVAVDAFDPVYKQGQFTIADYGVLDPSAVVSQSNAIFSLADHPLEESQLPKPIYPSQSFTAGDFVVVDPATDSRRDASFTIADYALIDPTTIGTPDAAFTAADYNIIADPSPEKLKVWDEARQQWVHAPRYIWHDDPGEWRQLS